MDTIVTIDSAGRVVIPKPLRDELRLAPGDTLTLELDGERMTLRPARSGAALQKERGIWVFRSGRTLPTAQANRALEGVRQERNGRERGTRE